ncbi:MAG: hypothetical protein U0807_12445 [Candidatus Binatia bacterium]
MAEPSDRFLWRTLRGASPWLAVGWLAWLALAAAGALLATPLIGPAGPVVVTLAAGWLLARRLPSPGACVHRFHLDDAEVTVLGPSRLVRRMGWGEIDTVTQEQETLSLGGPGLVAELPVGPVATPELWFHVLQRLVPPLAEELWEQLESGVIRLAPVPDPSTRSLAWWAYAPALAACGAAGLPGMVLLAAIGVAERLVVYGIRERRTVTIHPGGLAFREGRGLFVPWARATVTPQAAGLRVGLDDRVSGFVSSRIPNFWAVAAVVQLRAQIGPECPSRVHFRLRLANGGLAVVGEFDGVS